MQITIDNLNINFQVYGSGKPLIVLHGWGDRSDTWYNFAQALSNTYQVFLIDLPGFGSSDAPPIPWGVEEYAQVITKFIEELDIEAPVLLGHSHGGRIACKIAYDGICKENDKASNSAGTNNSKHCRALVLIASGGVDLPSLTVKLKILQFKTIKSLMRPLGKKGEQIIDNYRKKLGSRDYQDAGPMRATMVKVVNYKLFNLLPKINVPTLIVWGSEDKTLSFAQSKIFEKLMPDAYIKIIWGAGHHLNMDSALELADNVKTFLSDLDYQASNEPASSVSAQ